MYIMTAILVLVICAVVIAVAMRIYKESPKIRENVDDDLFN